MSEPKPWERRAVCPGCGWHTEANSLGAVSFLSCCPECGELYSWTSFGRASWPVATMRQVPLPKAKWWHSREWKWQTKGATHD
jgi:hypothetical protein